jgi:hypothetical protein
MVGGIGQTPARVAKVRTVKPVPKRPCVMAIVRVAPPTPVFSTSVNAKMPSIAPEP